MALCLKLHRNASLLAVLWSAIPMDDMNCPDRQRLRILYHRLTLPHISQGCMPCTGIRSLPGSRRDPLFYQPAAQPLAREKHFPWSNRLHLRHRSGLLTSRRFSNCRSGAGVVRFCIWLLEARHHGYRPRDLPESGPPKH